MQKKETMDLIEFTKKFPDEESCKTHFKALSDANASFYSSIFCYKFNRRYFNDMFDRLLLAASSCVPVFRHGYGKSASV